MIQPWPLISSEPIGDYRIFNLRRDRRRSPRTGNEHDFVVMSSPDWVNVIALTADAKPEQRDHGLRSGFTRYLAKPVAFAELVSVLESLKLDTLQRDPPGLPHSDPLER